MYSAIIIITRLHRSEISIISINCSSNIEKCFRFWINIALTFMKFLNIALISVLPTRSLHLVYNTYKEFSKTLCTCVHSTRAVSTLWGFAWVVLVPWQLQQGNKQTIISSFKVCKVFAFVRYKLLRMQDVLRDTTPPSQVEDEMENHSHRCFVFWSCLKNARGWKCNSIYGMDHASHIGNSIYYYLLNLLITSMCVPAQRRICLAAEYEYERTIEKKYSMVFSTVYGA